MKNTCMSSDYIPRFFPNSLPWTLSTLNSCMKDRCGFLFVRYKRHCCTELVSWEHAACLLSGIKKCTLVGGGLNTSSVVISIGATASVHNREVVCSWEGPLWEILQIYPTVVFKALTPLVKILYTTVCAYAPLPQQHPKLTPNPTLTHPIRVKL